MIINSLLDTDIYKFTMGQIAFLNHPDVDVEYRLTDRGGFRLADTVPFEEFVEEIQHVASLRFTHSDLHYLRGTNEYSERMFKEPYLQHLSNLKLEMPEIYVDKDRNFQVSIKGKWCNAIYWETFIMSILNELYYKHKLSGMKSLYKDLHYAIGVSKLSSKMHRITQEMPELKFCDFGTRRRFSREWHERVVEYLTQFPQCIGTSNVYLANKYNMVPIGTSAHECYMVMSGIMRDNLRESHNKTLQEWWDLYGHGLSIALTDTYGSDFFFEDFTTEQANNWKGLRQDSGDPVEFGYKAIKFYEDRGIDPKEKMIIFSDGLDIDSIWNLYKHFHNKVKDSYGYGTDLTNDLGFANLKVVVKVFMSNGYGTVKLSDNKGKRQGIKEDIDLFEKTFATKKERF